MSDDGSGLALAAIRHTEGQDVDGLISTIAADLKRKGYRVGGVVRSDGLASGGHRCDVMLEDLTTGQHHSISQQLGQGAHGCRLDTAALTHVATRVEAVLQEGLDLLILNKFGKQEAEGGGLRDAIAQAVAAEIPVIVGLNRAQEPAWSEFSGGEGQVLEADHAAVDRWLKKHLPNPDPHAGA